MEFDGTEFGASRVLRDLAPHATAAHLSACRDVRTARQLERRDTAMLPQRELAFPVLGIRPVA